MSEAKSLTERNEKIAAMLADGEQLKNFYRFIAQNPHINLHDACQIIIGRPNATVCYSFNEWAAMDMGHSYTSTVTKSPTCMEEGIRLNTCEKCGDSYETRITANGHNYQISDTTTKNGKTTRIYKCVDCGDSYKQELGDQYEVVANYVEYLFEQYSPYMWWVLLASAGIWSIVIGVMIAIAHKNEDKEKARKMLINYAVGLVVIAVIVVACPYLIRGIATLL